jgi:hypothetical protein
MVTFVCMRISSAHSTYANKLHTEKALARRRMRMIGDGIIRKWPKPLIEVWFLNAPFAVRGAPGQMPGRDFFRVHTASAEKPGKDLLKGIQAIEVYDISAVSSRTPPGHDPASTFRNRPPIGERDGQDNSAARSRR